jgi:hypothetical protein
MVAQILRTLLHNLEYIVSYFFCTFHILVAVRVCWHSTDIIIGV